jgi:hypothetical protein
MNKLPKHHYVPVFYLKQWVGADGKLVAFTRPHGDKVVATPKPPTHTGYVRGLYWLEGSDPEIANRLETIIMGRIDSNAAIAHQLILRDDISSLSKDVRIAWARFIVGLLLRSPKMTENIYTRMVTPGSKEFKELSQEFAKDFPGMRYEDIPPQQMRRGALLTLAHLLHNAEVEKMMNAMIWSVYDLVYPELRFFTSDRPVIMTNGIGTKSGHLAIPISPRKLFLAFANEQIKSEIQSTMSPWHIVENTNKVVIRGAIEVVWDTTKSRLPFVQQNFSADAENDRNFFATTGRRR